MNAAHGAAADAKETARIEAFSDGVFAIAITLLVLDLKVPRGMAEGRDLLAALVGQWPAYLAFVTSFATIGIMWINHHRMFTLIRRTDDGLLVLNGLLLLGVTFVPFPTGVLAEYTPRAAGRVAAAVYSGTYVAIAIFFNLLWWYAAHRKRLLRSAADRAVVQAITRAYSIGPLCYALAFGLAFQSVAASLVLNLALAIFWALPSQNPLVKKGIGEAP
ncbi:MAG TPA: TMEM175 family protein [bacterium]